MNYLRKRDFTFQTNIAGITSPIAVYTCPQSEVIQLKSDEPINLSITAYQTFTVATPSATFTVTPSYLLAPLVTESLQVIYPMTAVAYDLTKNLGPFYPISISGNTLTFAGITGSATNDTIGVWYRLGTGTYTLYVQSGQTTSVSRVIMSGDLMALNVNNQFYSKNLVYFPENAPLAPGDQLVLAVTTQASVSMVSTSIIPSANLSYDINQAATIKFPIEIIHQPGS